MSPRPAARPGAFRRVWTCLGTGPLVALLVALLVAMVVAACGPSVTTSPTGSSGASPSAAARTTRIPILIDVQDAVGPSRFLFSFADAQNNSIAAPDMSAKVAFFDIGKSATTPVATADGRFIWAIEGTKGLYAADVTFTEAGDWAADFTTTKAGLTETTRVMFQVAEKSSTPQVGAKAPVTRTPTLADVGGNVKALSTDTKPDPAFYMLSEDDAIKGHIPFVLVFATPAFCTSRQCGPTLDQVKAVAHETQKVSFINVEPYKLEYANDRLQPVLDANGQLQATDVTNAWGLLTEPWIFVVDRNGIVRASFAVVASPDELRAAISAVAT